MGIGCWLLFGVVGSFATGWAVTPEAPGQVRRLDDLAPGVSAVEVIYHVDPKELVGALMVILAIWECMKWFVVEASKTLLVDAVLRTLGGWCRRRAPAPEVPRVLVAPPQAFDAHSLGKIYKLSTRGDYKVHLFETCRRLDGKTPTEQQICSECIDTLQERFTSTLFEVLTMR